MSTFTQLFNVAQSGMRLNMLDLDTISNNLANINTEGFKESRLDFQELLAQNMLDGSRLANQTLNFSQGSFKLTSRDMDWAISGDGFFGIRMQDGTVAYTRQGSFQLDSNLNIVTGDGDPLVWNGTLPTNATNIHIDSEGNVMYSLDSDITTSYNAGQVQLYRFVNPSGLENVGDNLYIESDASGDVISGQPNTNGLGYIQGKTLESSNVSISEQMSQMIIAQRIFQTTSKAMTQSNDMISKAIAMRLG